MGQYHYLVNLDKREFINPHKLAVGLKACEQLTSPVSTPQALIGLAKDIRAARQRGEEQGLSDEEIAFLRRPRRERECGTGHGG